MQREILTFFKLSLTNTDHIKYIYCDTKYNSFTLSGAYSGPHERRLLNDLLNQYNKLERPAVNESDAVVLIFGLTLQQIIDVVSHRININQENKYLNQLILSQQGFKVKQPFKNCLIGPKKFRHVLLLLTTFALIQKVIERQSQMCLSSGTFISYILITNMYLVHIVS